MTRQAEHTRISELVSRARSLIVPGQRRILGLVGAPGAGKSSLSAALARSLGADAVVVGLDAFHLSNAVLHELGRHERKGAADTFDAAGYVNLLRRLRDRADPVVYAGMFDRSIEETIAGSVPVPRDIPLIITEGNYLLVDDEEWGCIRDLLDESWFVDPGEEVRIDRLVARHERFGRSPEEARNRSLGSDQRNAELILASRHRADRIITLGYDSEIDDAKENER